MQFTVRAGVTAEVSITYQLEPRATARFCAVNCQASSQICAKVYESWPGNSIDLYAWYQTRRIRWCGGWVCSCTINFDSSCILFISDIINNRLGTLVELDGGVDVAGVH